MLRVKKISDAIFPRDFSIAYKSYKEYYKKQKQEKRNSQIADIVQHYESQLQSLKKRVPKEKYSKKITDIQSQYKRDPFLYAEKHKLEYQLSSLEIKRISERVSTKLFKSKAEKEQIQNKIKERELENISECFNEEIKKLIEKNPPTTEYVYEDTDESINFQNQYKNKYEKYAKEFGLELDSTEEFNCSQYAFAYEINYINTKTINKVYTNNEAIRARYGSRVYLLDLNQKDLDNLNSQVIMYSPKLDDEAFFLYKNCLYQAEFNEFFTNEELLLKVKEKIYKEDKKFEQLKKQIELYENSDLSETSKKKTREPIPEDVKFEVWRRDQGRCVICGSQENLEFDHIIPFSKGGSSTARNIQLLCQNCNRHKSDKI